MSLAGRLYRGETNFELVGRRKLWFTVSAVLMLICVVSMVTRGFNLSVDFKGGSTYQFSSKTLSLQTYQDAFDKAGANVQTAQIAGSGDQRQLIVTTATLSGAKSVQVADSVAKTLGVQASDLTESDVSSSWGSDVSTKALQGLIVFLIVVAIYIAIRFEARMAIAAMLALLHDLVLSAGIYSIVGFEVTPSTIVGLLTILGFSLYDTVVVFDKVAENSKGILGGSRQTYSEAANLAVNQTFMRSINTSLISLLPVAGLLFVGAGLLGVGTLKDLALVLFVGLASGAYSSLFLATPLLATLKERERPYAALAQRVASRRAAPAAAGGSRRSGGSAKATGAGRAGAATGGKKPTRSSGAATAVLDRDEEPADADEADAGPTTAAGTATTDEGDSASREARRRRREARIAKAEQAKASRDEAADLTEQDDLAEDDPVEDDLAEDDEIDDELTDGDAGSAEGELHEDADSVPTTSAARAGTGRGRAGAARPGARPAARRKGGRPSGKKRPR